MMTSLVSRRGEEKVWKFFFVGENAVLPHCNCKVSVLILFLQKECTICSLFLLHSHAHVCACAFPEVFVMKKTILLHCLIVLH